MSTVATLPTNSSSSSPSPSSTSGGVFTNSGSLTSLYLYTFIATLSLLFFIFGALVARSMRLRRRRNNVLLAAIATGTTVPPTRNGKRRSDLLSHKPKLWEVLVTPGPHDPEKRWAEILPVAGATLVPVTQQTPAPLLRPASWSPRQFLWPFGRDPSALDLPTTARSTSSLQPPASPTPLPPPEPVCLTVLVSMPTQTPRRAKHEIVGPPVVEFGVAHVSYAHPPAVS